MTATRSVTCPSCHQHRVVQAQAGWSRYVPLRDLCCSWPCARTYRTMLRAAYLRHGQWGDPALRAFVRESGMLCDEVAVAVQAAL